MYRDNARITGECALAKQCRLSDNRKSLSESTESSCRNRRAEGTPHSKTLQKLCNHVPSALIALRCRMHFCVDALRRKIQPSRRFFQFCQFAERSAK